MTRTSIPVTEETRDELTEFKGTESWDAFLRSLADGAEPKSDPSVPDDVLREDHIDDIAERVSRRTTEQIETRLR